MPNETVLEKLKRLMAERDAHDEGSPSFLVKNLGLGIEANRALPSLITAAEALRDIIGGVADDDADAAMDAELRADAALAPLTKEVPHE